MGSRKSMPEVFTEEFLEWFEGEYGESRECLTLGFYNEVSPESYIISGVCKEIPLDWEEEVVEIDTIASEAFDEGATFADVSVSYVCECGRKVQIGFTDIDEEIDNVSMLKRCCEDGECPDETDEETCVDGGTCIYFTGDCTR